VERFGGTTEIDLATNTINIDVPSDQEASCAEEIEEQMTAHFHAHAPVLSV
jgi:hypothetical protein